MHKLSSTPNWNITEVKSHLSSNCVLFKDPNDQYNKVLSLVQIEKELKKKVGKSYEMISHMSHIYSMAFKQYSDLKFEQTDKNETIVSIADWYKLIFENKQNMHLLKGCEYLQLEGE